MVPGAMVHFYVNLELGGVAHLIVVHFFTEVFNERVIYEKDNCYRLSGSREKLLFKAVER